MGNSGLSVPKVDLTDPAFSLYILLEYSTPDAAEPSRWSVARRLCRTGRKVLSAPGLCGV